VVDWGAASGAMGLFVKDSNILNALMEKVDRGEILFQE
jgi:hypothetical protein